MSSKSEYIDFYAGHPDISIFSSPWWLDATAGENNWDVILVYDNQKHIIASFPYVRIRGKFGSKEIGMPLLTQKMGPYILYNNQLSYTKKIGYEHRIYNEIIAQIPKFDFFSVCFDQDYKNWLPFHWNGFDCTPRYSYKLFDIKNTDAVFAGLDKVKRNYIKRARQNFTLRYDLPIDDFYDYFEDVVRKRGDKVNYSRALLTDIYKAVYEKNRGRVLYCTDNESGEIAAIQLIVWDNNAAYALVGIRSKKYNSSGSTEYLLFECIKYAANFVDVFDFEGGMLKGVEESYRKFGTQQTEYYNISKENRIIFPLLKKIKNKFCH